MPIKIYKPIGITPFELVKKFKTENNISQKVSFAGRLDPMAHGEMVLLIGDECKKQDTYCGRDKIYEFDILYGFTTDTLDILGISCQNQKFENNNIEKLKGEYEQSYPLYSSKTIGNKKKEPLWKLAQSGLGNDLIPKKTVNIMELEKLGENSYNNLELLAMISDKLSMLSDDYKERFRYSIIKNKWEENLKINKIFKIEKYRATVSSGTYIRSLCERMGGIAYDINRIKVL